MLDDRTRKLLLTLTSLPTAAGEEDAVLASVRAWAKRRKRILLAADAAGNLTLRLREEAGGGPPVLLVAHTDHPAAVVAGIDPGDPRRLRARFRGGVSEPHFRGSAVRLWRGGRRCGRGVVVGVDRREASGPDADDPVLAVAFARPVEAEPGDVLAWDLPAARVRGSRLQAPACDDLAGVAAALATLDAQARRRSIDPGEAPLRVLLTRAEEVGFVGAVAACLAGTLEPDARVIVLECSKASAEAPLGAGPVVRVGDRSSTFDPALTAAVASAAAELAGAPVPGGTPAFRWQRKLMTGGTCEATAYAAFGLAATCVCVPLGNYHNMSDTRPGTIEREVISLRDFGGMLRLLAALPARLGPGVGGGAAALRDRLVRQHAGRAGLLAGEDA
ncbi:zinc-binding metallopeptidase family protein [Phycisphaera mikurensis]|uniref:Peptidase M42 family protein n=1 Tax=Phycisphaera mikurensis (strain NBRC 102666 / KCTC 22515 / FYK2301M01) TaxID=1142394 RepID=I0IHX3_PHYMF|nr:hypothetical protein [Phycisphaera mikurensis]MBB6441101.1 endoglucanase [Phycisphaera mikurensis]BAM04861.1 hypothetical protein PSMK_27020 [Phycisphaera mikurensis NBRC 102666]